MGEIKSVKVDNWGVFFLQKLQNFFNKTDFCDLTLQFRDNSQLKVHRLVLSACTDFFNVLEQTCELMDDALVMPAELQADVVVPIVNFMYTGTLEFELKMYSKLLRTAKEMNMTVLLKLLEAHKRTMEGTRNSTNVGPPTPRHRRVQLNPNAKPMQTSPSVKAAPTPPQRIQIIHSITPQQKRQVMKPTQDRNAPRPVVGSNTILKTAPRLQRGPTRFEESTSTQAETYESSFDSISYESKPLKEEPEDYAESQTSSQWNRSSPFEQLRKGFNNNKRPAVATFTSPPAKKPNIEDVKEFSEQQRMRKQIAAEFGDDAEFDSIMDDEFHHDDDDEEPAPLHVQNTNPSSSSLATVKQQHHHQQQQQQQQQHSSIIIKQSPNEKPTIVVKDSSNSKMDHAKIISEVLRQYPHLVKSNKNIKLKIMPNVGGQTQKIIVKKETIDNMSAEMEQETSEKPQSRQQFGSPKQQSIIRKPFKSYAAAQTAKPAESQASVSKGAQEAKVAAPSAAPQKRRIDSKTMHALIAQGAENTTGPWLCLRCGVNGRPISIPSYRGFRRHLINTHKEIIDAALCEHCGWRSKTSRELHHHMLVDHQVPSLLYTFPQCKECTKICLNENDLLAHSEQYHPDAHKQQCIYCNKVFVKEMALYTHMKTFHKKRAREDGVIDFSDDEMDIELEAPRSTAQSGNADSKIKILSDIALPSTLLKLENSATTEEEDYGNDTGPKFVNADGNEMVLTAEQREEIMSQLDQDHDGGVVMVLNESVFPPEEGGGGGGVGDVGEAEHNLKMKLEASETENPVDFDEQNTEFLTAPDIDLRGTEMSSEEHVEEEPTKPVEDETTQPEQHQESEDENEHENENDDHMDDDDHMEWAENLISAHDHADDDEEHKEDDEKDLEEDKIEKENDTKNVKEEEKVSLEKSIKEEKPAAKKADDINMKLKMLTGDWTDDEIDDEEEDEAHEELPQPKEEKEKPVDPELTLASLKSESDKVKSDVDAESKQLDESMDEFENEADLDANNSIIGEDELTQFSQPEKVEEEREAIKEETSEDAKPQSVVDEDIVSESEVAAPAADEKAKEEDVAEQEAKFEGRTSRRTSSIKESDLKKSSSEDVSDVKESTLPSKETKTEAEDETEHENTETIDKDKDSVLSKAVEDDEANLLTKSETEEDSSKTPDKVKSLLNEWADDDDDL